MAAALNHLAALPSNDYLGTRIQKLLNLCLRKSQLGSNFDDSFWRKQTASLTNLILDGARVGCQLLWRYELLTARLTLEDLARNFNRLAFITRQLFLPYCDGVTLTNNAVHL